MDPNDYIFVLCIIKIIVVISIKEYNKFILWKSGQVLLNLNYKPISKQN